MYIEDVLGTDENIFQFSYVWFVSIFENIFFIKEKTKKENDFPNKSRKNKFHKIVSFSASNSPHLHPFPIAPIPIHHSPPPTPYSICLD